MKLPLTVAAALAIAGCSRNEGVFHGCAIATVGPNSYG